MVYIDKDDIVCDFLPFDLNSGILRIKLPDGKIRRVYTCGRDFSVSYICYNGGKYPLWMDWDNGIAAFSLNYPMS